MPDNVNKKLGLNLLSLDGGGITGLSSLLIIKELMNRLGAKGKQGSIPKPCEHFDMIAGTGTGAISAVMLGRLRMSIDDAITSYLQLMKSVFSDRKYTIKGDTGAFKSTVLEKELKAIIHREVGNENEMMMEGKDSEDTCKVVVYAMSAYNATSGLPVAFRSYSSTAPTTKCAIWEALRATTAHPEMFKCIEVDAEGTGIRDMFSHGGFGCTNPTPRLLEEARREYPDRGVASIISIGTGHPKAIQFAAGRTGSVWAIGGSMMTKVMQAAREMAEGSERVAEEMARRFADVGSGYYRLNVQQGTQGMEASEWERLSEIAAHTRSYLGQAETKSKLDELVETISQRAAVLEAAQIDGHVVLVSEPMPGSIRSCPPSSIRFTGRETCTKQVREYLTHRSQGRFIFVLYGLGGAGKTQIALKCVEEMKEWFKHVIFIDASSDKRIQASLAAIASDNNIGKTYEDMLNWIGRHGRDCLIVLDNADDPRMNLRTYLPRGEDYNVLITTRCREFATLAGDNNAVHNVSGLEHDEAVELLLKTAKLEADKRSEEDKAAIDKLLKSFDYLALAVVQAGAYIWNTQLSVSQYWEKYTESRQKVLEGGLGLDEYAGTVYTTWELSLKQLNPHAKELLFLIAFLHRDEILEETFQRATRNMRQYESDIQPTPEQSVVENQVKVFLGRLVDNDEWNDLFAKYIGDLMSFSLVNYDQMSRVYRIHPLVQDWAQAAASLQAFGLHHTALLLAMSIDWGKSSVDHSYKRRILPHINLLIERGETYKSDVAERFAEVYRATGEDIKEATLWEGIISTRKLQLGERHLKTLTSTSSLARTYWEQRRLEEAKELLETTLATQKCVAGEEHPDTLKTMHHLAWTYDLQSRYAEAEKLMAMVVDSRKRVLGETHPDVLESMDDLATIYEHRGQLTKAEELRMTVLATRKQTLGVDHSDTLEGMQNLASTYRAQGRLSEAEELYALVITARKRVQGEDHPDTLFAIHELAYTYREQGRLGDAETLYRNVVDSRKRVLGEEHPSTLISMANLAYTYRKEGQLEDSVVLYTNVIAARKRVLGEDHHDTLCSIDELAYTYRKQGKLADAGALYETVVTTWKRTLGEDHPDTLLSMQELAYTYRKQGRLADAAALYTSLIASRKRVLGEDHPKTLSSMDELAYVYRKQRRFSDSRSLYATVVASQKQSLGEDHPRTLTSMANLASVHQEQGRLAEAEALYLIVVASQKKVLGDDHPSTLTSMADLGHTYYHQRRFVEAENLETAVLASRRRILGQSHPDTISTVQNLVAIYSALGKRAESETLQKELAITST
ncbi:unnamed protein product [Rhizoctonia solani]|uniref:PNPLA domain-containing protein n=1 Tax=Rhizoctonia solani TaxID=456999 RepID=A0A8H3CB29_9AGAM|nr:unnamed protein product [Rhizoctonia solani]